MTAEDQRGMAVQAVSLADFVNTFFVELQSHPIKTIKTIMSVLILVRNLISNSSW